MKHKKYLVIFIAIVVPLMYVGRLTFDVLKGYEGFCMGLLDAQGPPCTKVEYVADYLTNVFALPYLGALLLAWEMAILIAFMAPWVISRLKAKGSK